MTKNFYSFAKAHIARCVWRNYAKTKAKSCWFSIVYLSKKKSTASYFCRSRICGRDLWEETRLWSCSPSLVCSMRPLIMQQITGKIKATVVKVGYCWRFSSSCNVFAVRSNSPSI